MYKKAPSIKTAGEKAVKREQTLKRELHWEKLLSPYKEELVPYLVKEIRAYIKGLRKDEGQKTANILNVSVTRVKSFAPTARKALKLAKEQAKIKKSVKQPKLELDV